MRIAPPRTSRSPVRRFYAPGGGNRGGLAPQLVTGKRISQWWIKRVLWTVAASAAQILPLRAGDDAQRPMLMVGGIRHERARVCAGRMGGGALRPPGFLRDRQG